MVACDLDGVVYIDGSAIPGAGRGLTELRASGRRVVFVTNNATKTPDSVAETVERLTGFEVGTADIVTSALVTAHELQGLAQNVMVIGAQTLTDIFIGAGFDVVEDRKTADAVVVGLHPGLTYDILAEAALAIRGGAMFYATNTDGSYPTADGLKPGGGAIVAALIAATGVQPVVCGKPHRPVRYVLRSMAGSGEVLVVGDRLETDIALGKAEAWLTALVLSGVTSPGDPIPSGLAPDIIVDSLADLPGVLAG